MKIVLLSVVLAIIASTGNAGKGHKGKGHKGKHCGHGIMKQIHEGKVEGEDFKEFLACLKDKHRDIPGKMVKFITTKAGGKVSKNCHKLIEEDGCDADYSQHLKNITGLEDTLTAGDLCVKTCSKDDEDAGDDEDEDDGDEGEGHNGKHCGHGIMKKIKQGKFEGEDFKEFLACLKDKNRDIPGKMVKFITTKAGGEVSKNCHKLIEEDGCDADFSKQLKDITGLEDTLTAGDLCVKTCSEDAGDDEDQKSLQRKFQFAAVTPFDRTSSMWVSAALPLAAAMIAAGIVVQAVRRARTSGEDVADSDCLLDEEIE